MISAHFFSAISAYIRTPWERYSLDMIRPVITYQTAYDFYGFFGTFKCNTDVLQIRVSHLLLVRSLTKPTHTHMHSQFITGALIEFLIRLYIWSLASCCAIISGTLLSLVYFWTGMHSVLFVEDGN